MIGVIGDMHMKEELSYADYISDRRKAEKKEILDFIVESFKDCQHIVLMGDNFHSKNNSSETNREFVEFLERFGKKEVYILSGNHEKRGDGKTAIDFLGEIDRKNWHIITKPADFQIHGKSVDFLPYMLNSELGVEIPEEASKEIMKHLVGGELLFAHHMISGTSVNGIKTDLFKEVVLPKDKLEKKYKLVIAGHVHAPQEVGRTTITGNIFTTQVGDLEKFIYTIDDKLGVKKIKLPGRAIIKLENPKELDIVKLPKHSIVKIVLTDKSINAEDLLVVVKRMTDACLLVEDYPSGRKKMHVEEGAMDFSIEALLQLYAKEKGVDYQKLLKGYEIIHG